MPSSVMIFSAGHLLDLEADRGGVLEQERDHRPDRDPPLLLEGDDLGAELVRSRS
jgi:hypothetical protein